MGLIRFSKSRMKHIEKTDRGMNNSKCWLHFLLQEFHLTIQEPAQI